MSMSSMADLHRPRCDRGEVQGTTCRDLCAGEEPPEPRALPPGPLPPPQAQQDTTVIRLLPAQNSRLSLQTRSWLYATHPQAIYGAPCHGHVVHHGRTARHTSYGWGRGVLARPGSSASHTVRSEA